MKRGWQSSTPTAIALAAALVFTACRRDPPPPVPDAGLAAAPIDRRALLVGVDRYRDPGITALRGARNDVEAMRGLLIERHGFAPDAIHTLLGPEATGDAIVAAFRSRLIDGAGPGTIAVFHFSGHGRRVWDTSGDEPDGWDEAIVPYDAGSDLADAGLVDDVFAPLVDALVARGAAVTLIFDSCYSGSPVRGGAAVRSAPSVGGARGADAAAGAGDVLEGRPGATVIAAAQSTEKAHEVEDAAGQHHGALTWALVRTLRAAPADATWRAVMAEVRHRVGLVFAQQTPLLGGERPDRVVFERAEKPLPPRSFAVEAAGDRVRIAAGSLHGVTAGSVFALVGPDGAARGRVVVTRVGAASAEARAEGGVGAGTAADPPAAPATAGDRSAAATDRPGIGGAPADSAADRPEAAAPTAPADRAPPEAAPAVPPGTRAVEVARSGPADRLPVAVIGAEAGAVAQTLSAAGVRVVDPTEARLRVAVDGGVATLLGPDGRPLGEPIALAARGTVAVVPAVLAAGRWLHLAELTGAPAEGVRFTIDGGEALAPGLARARPGDAVRLVVRNDGSRRWYAAVIDVADDGSLAVLWPRPREEAVVEPGEGFTVPAEGALVLHPPLGRAASRDVVHLILTSRPADFTALGETPRAGSAPAGHPLLGWFTAAERGAGEPAALDDGAWALHTVRLVTCGAAGCPEQAGR